MPASLDGGIQFSDAYRDDVFWIWYRSGKPSVPGLYNMIPEFEPAHRRPSSKALQLWYKDFKIRAEELDNAALDEMKALAVKAKVEMLNRHAKLATKMQDMGFKVLDAAEATIGTATAVRLIIEGVRIERESVGIPSMLDKLSNMEDQELLDKINELVTKAPIEIEALDE